MKSHYFALYTTPVSANGRKVLAVAQQLNLNPEINIIDVYRGDGQIADYLTINPFGKIPTLVEGDFILWESNAILQYMSEAFGEYQLSSRDNKIRADIARWLFWESCHWQPAVSTVLAGVVGHALLPHIMPAPTENPAWENLQFTAYAKYLNTHLEEHRFLVNDALSIADFSIAGMMTYFRFGKFPFDQYPHIERWYQSIEKLEAWKNTQESLWE